MDKIYKEQTGTINLTIYKNGDIMDLSGADLIEVKFEKPDNETFLKTAQLVNDGTDGLIKCIFSSESELSLIGIWHLQAIVYLGDRQFRSDILRFRVYTI